MHASETSLQKRQQKRRKSVTSSYENKRIDKNGVLRRNRRIKMGSITTKTTQINDVDVVVQDQT